MDVDVIVSHFAAPIVHCAYSSIAVACVQQHVLPLRCVLSDLAPLRPTPRPVVYLPSVLIRVVLVFGNGCPAAAAAIF